MRMNIRIRQTNYSSCGIAAEDEVRGISHIGHRARISVGESDAASARGESVMAIRKWPWLCNKQNDQNVVI